MSPTIVFLGDGLTASGNWEEWLPDYNVVNLAVSGNTVDDVIGRLDEVDTLSPDAVVLQVGTNDLGARKSDEYVVRKLETLLSTLRRRQPHTLILVQSVLPREPDFAQTIRSINRHLWQFAPTQHAQYLDLWPTFAQQSGGLDPEYSIDSVHLTQEGYAAWLTELKPTLQLLMEHPPSRRRPGGRVSVPG
jgi:lysophospholipase L1-like esterase